MVNAMPDLWPTNWARVHSTSLRDTAIANAKAATEECARRRHEREDAEQEILNHYAEAEAQRVAQQSLGALTDKVPLDSAALTYNTGLSGWS